MWYIHTAEYYSALKWKQIFQYATTWMSLECIMLNELNQSQKDKYNMIPLCKVLRIVKIIKMESVVVVRGCGGEENVELMFNRYQVLVLQDKGMGMGGVDSCTTAWMYLVSLNCTLKSVYDGKFYVYFITHTQKTKNVYIGVCVFSFTSGSGMAWHSTDLSIVTSQLLRPLCVLIQEVLWFLFLYYILSFYFYGVKQYISLLICFSIHLMLFFKKCDLFV